MKRCKTCEKRWYPPLYVRQSGLCEDCLAGLGAPYTDERTHVSSTHSPTAEAIRRLEVCKIRLTETRLPAEDERSLRREIERYLIEHPDEQSLYLHSNITKNRLCR